MLIAAPRESNRVMLMTDLQSEGYILYVCKPRRMHLINEAPLGLKVVEKHVNFLTQNIRV